VQAEHKQRKNPPKDHHKIATHTHRRSCTTIVHLGAGQQNVEVRSWQQTRTRIQTARKRLLPAKAQAMTPARSTVTTNQYPVLPVTGKNCQRTVMPLQTLSTRMVPISNLEARPEISAREGEHRAAARVLYKAGEPRQGSQQNPFQ